MEILKGSFDEYTYYNGYHDTKFAEKIKSGEIAYYYAFKDGEFLDNIYVFEKDNNEINLNISLRPFNEDTKGTVDYFSNIYDEVTFKMDTDMYDSKIFDYIKQNYNVIKEDSKEINVRGKIIKLDYLTVKFK